MQVQSLFRSVLWTLNSFPVKDVVVLRCDCISFRRVYFLLALLFCGQSRQTWLSWKEHLFLSFFPLWGNQYNLQTQMYGRRVELWAILLEREKRIENHLSFAPWFCRFVNLEWWMISLDLVIAFYPLWVHSLTKGFFAFLFPSFKVKCFCWDLMEGKNL